MNATTTPALLLQELLQTISHIGNDRTILCLKNAREKGNPKLSDPVISFVLTQVCGHFTIAVDDLFRPVQTDKQKYAMALCVFYLAQEFGYKHRALAALFSKSRDLILKRQRMIRDLNPRSRVDKQYLDMMALLDGEIKNYQAAHHIKN